MPPIFTAAAAFIASAIGVTSVIGVALINFGVRVLATVVISKLITRKQDSGAAAVTQPNRTTVNANTINKLPVIYGSAFMGGIITDAKISTDQKYMWFVLSVSEVTDTGTISFDDPNNPGYPLIYWADKKVQFDATNRYKVTGLINVNDPAEPVDTKVNGLMDIYFYNNGSNSPLYGAPNAITLLNDATTGGGIPVDQRWPSTNTMNNTSFMIIRIKYSQDANLTGLQAVTARVTNTLDKPGSVMYDYLTNDRYGAGMDPNLVLTSSFSELNDYSDQLITYDGSNTQVRYRINGPLDTNNNCLENLLQLTEACDSWLQWNEQEGKWSIIINCSYQQAGYDIGDLFTIYADTLRVDTNGVTPSEYYAYVTGGVDITPIDLNATYNRIEVNFPNKDIKDQQDQVYIETPSNLMNPNEPINQLSITLPQVNDNVQAQYLANRRLEQARDDLIVTLATDYGGIQVDAGDVVRVYHQMYGWTQSQGFPNGKLFRVTQVQEAKDENGNLGARLTLTEYNGQVYDNFSITSYQPAQNTGITDPTIISTPPAPIVSSQITTSAIPSFLLTATIPLTGSVLAMEFWYAIASSPPTSTTQFKLYETQYYNSGAVFPNNTSISIVVTGLPTSAGQNYYFIVRAAGAQSKSLYSNNSAGLSWNPNPTATVTGQNFQAVYQPGTISVAMFGNGQPDLANVVVSLYGLSGPGQVDYNSNISNLSNNQWSIDSPNIVYSGIAFASPPTDAGTFAQWPAPTSMSGNVATISAPIKYKDTTGNLFTSPPASITLTKNLPGQEGGRGVVTLAYVPVNYNPTYGNSQATDSNLTSSFATTTGFTPPIDKDGAVFFNTTTGQSSSRRYNTTGTPYKWESATLQVPGEVVTDNSINTNQIKANSIVAGKIASGAVTANTIDAFAVTAGKIAANAITTNTIDAFAVTASKIATNTITANNISAGAITTTTLAANAVTAGKIDADAITSDTIAAGAITVGKIAANAVTAGTIAVGAVTAGTIDVGAVTAGTIAANAVDANALQAFSITSGKIAAGAITATSIAANTITFENLVIGAVTQSRSTISDPIIEPIPFYNWNNNPKTWPNNTRCIVPAGGVSIIPSTDPRSSANIQYVEGSRIEVSFSVKLWTSNPAFNLVEIWKSGASSIYDRGFNSVRHSYDVSYTQTSPNTIHAYGSGGLVYYSNDGGASWFQVNGSTTKTISGAITAYNSSSSTVAVQVTGPLQVSDTSITAYASYKYQTFSNPGLIDMVFDWNPSVGGQSSRGDYYAIEAVPRTGKSGGYLSGFNYQLGRIIVGGSGVILTRYTDLIGESAFWTAEASNTLKTLYSVYGNDVDMSNNRSYTAITVGQTGTLLKSLRTWINSGTFTWMSKTLTLRTGGTLLSDLYGVAGDDTYGTSSKWVAVGEYGMIQVSTNNGETWSQVLSPTPDNLNAVRYCNGRWIIVGDNGIILSATDPTQDTGTPNGWTQINTGLTTQNLFSVDYSPVHNTINIGGQDGLYHSSASGTINFSLVVVNAPNEILDLTRMTYYGSYPLVNQVSPQPPAEQQILNNQVFSATLVDTGYSAGQETTYYLVVGNMAGAQVLAGQIYLQVTEVKR